MNFYDGIGVKLTGPYYANKWGTGKQYTAATGSNEIFIVYHEDTGYNRLKNAQNETIGFTKAKNYTLADPRYPPP